MRTRWVQLGLAVLALVALATACGGGDDASVSSDEGTTATTAAAASNDGGSDGADGNDVLEVQRELVSLNCNPGPLDGELGPDTVRAIRFFQQTVGLTADGVVGPETRAALSNAAQAGSPFCPNIPPPPPPTTAATTATTSGGGGGGGGTPPCTDAAIRPAVIGDLNTGEQLFQLNAFHCAITWAVVSPTVGPSQQDSYEITELLRWNGSAWQVVDRGTYCDAGEVPQAIYQQACETN